MAASPLIWHEQLDMLCKRALHTWEAIHSGLDGLQYCSADLNDSTFTVHQQESTCCPTEPVRCLQAWAPGLLCNTATPSPAEAALATKAYWAARVFANSLTINLTLLNLLHAIRLRGYTHVRHGDAMLSLASADSRVVSLVPKRAVLMMEPPFISKVNARKGDSQATYEHVFVVIREDRNAQVLGRTDILEPSGSEPAKEQGRLFVVDCTAAQFGEFGSDGEAYVVAPVTEYLNRVCTSYREPAEEEKKRLAEALEEEHGKAKRQEFWKALEACLPPAGPSAALSELDFGKTSGLGVKGGQEGSPDTVFDQEVCEDAPVLPLNSLVS